MKGAARMRCAAALRSPLIVPNLDALSQKERGCNVRFRPIADISLLGQAMRMFTYSDTVLVNADAPAEIRPGQKGSVIGITTEHERSGSHFDQFPAGTIYLVEFEGGEALDIHGGMLQSLET